MPAPRRAGGCTHFAFRRARQPQGTLMNSIAPPSPNGARTDGSPLRPIYPPNYYGALCSLPDGHKIRSLLSRASVTAGNDLILISETDRMALKIRLTRAGARICRF